MCRVRDVSTVRGALRRSNDRGITLVETMVAVSLMSVVMVMFTTGMVRMYHSFQRSEASSTAQSQLTAAFGRLDRQVRYAAQISAVGSENETTGAATQNYWYVEFATAAPDAVGRCTQLRLPRNRPGSLLQIRDWDAGTTPPPFTTLASLIDRMASTPPFTRTPPQLRVRLSSTVSSAPGKVTTRQSDVTFTALNFTADTADVDACAQRRTS